MNSSWNGVVSATTPDIFTCSTPDSRSSSAENTGTCRRYGSWSLVSAGDEAVAKFLAMMRKRSARARMPEGATSIDFNIFMSFSPLAISGLRHAQSGAPQREKFFVETGRLRVFHLRFGDLHHLLLDHDAIAVGRGLRIRFIDGACRPVRERTRAHVLRVGRREEAAARGFGERRREVRRRQILRHETGRR